MLSSDAFRLPKGLDVGSPTIFFDSHPEEQESYLYSYVSSLKTSLKIAWSGVVPKPLEPGTLRIIFYTTSGSKGIKDYELNQYALVRDNFDEMMRQPEVRRCVVMGYSGQNPYLRADGGSNPWVDKFARDQKGEKQRLEKREGAASGSTSKVGKWKEEDMAADIDNIIKKSEQEELERKKAEFKILDV